MVWCPIHNFYVRGKKSKHNHAHDSLNPCKWMQNYLLKSEVIYNKKEKEK
jgi:hypothetical protein